MTRKAKLPAAPARLAALALLLVAPSGCGYVGGMFQSQRTPGVDLAQKPPSVTDLPEAPREAPRAPEPDFSRTEAPEPRPLNGGAELVYIPDPEPEPTPDRAPRRATPPSSGAAGLPPAPRPLDRHERALAGHDGSRSAPVRIESAPALDLPPLEVVAPPAPAPRVGSVSAPAPELVALGAPQPQTQPQPEPEPQPAGPIYDPAPPPESAAPRPAPPVMAFAESAPIAASPVGSPVAAAPQAAPRIAGRSGAGGDSPVMILHARMGDGAVVSVHPVVGVPAASSAMLARTLASEMGERVDAAAAASAPSRFDLRGRSVGGARVQWTLEQPSGSVVGVFAEGDDAATLDSLTGDALRGMSRRIADRLRRNPVLRGGSRRFAVSEAPSTASQPQVAAPVVSEPPSPAPRRRPRPESQPQSQPQPQPAPVRTARRAPETAPPPPLRPRRSAEAPRALSQPPVIQAQPVSTAPPSLPEYRAPSAPSVAAAPPAPSTAVPAPSFETLRPAEQVATPSGPRPLVFRGVSGAPGDGDQALGREVRRLLADSGARIISQDEPGALYLLAEVSKSPGASSDHIRIVWRVEDARGASIGQVVQENDVPSGALDAAWGQDAFYAAQGARNGIMELLQAAGVIG